MRVNQELEMKILAGFHFYGRQALESESIPVWEELLSSLHWNQ